MQTPRRILKQLDSPETVDRLEAVEALLRRDDASAPGYIAARLELEDSPEVKEAIFRAFSRMRSPAADETLVTLLRHPSTEIRRQAVRVLQQRGESALPPLTRAMRSGKRGLRKLVLEVLCEFEGDAGEIWDLAMSDRDPEVVVTAVVCAARKGRHRFAAQIEQHLLEAADPVLLKTCMEALAAIGDSHSVAVVRRRFPTDDAVPLPLLPAWLQLTTPRHGRVHAAGGGLSLQG